MSGVRHPKDFPQTPCVKGIKALSQGLGDGPCLAPVEQDWKDVCPVEVHLGSCVNMGPPDTHLASTTNITSMTKSKSCNNSHDGYSD